jgi:uncharacterized protein (DUF983 family)
MTEPAPLPERPVRRALMHGLKGRCPRCGEGRLFAGFLLPAPSCVSCGQSFEGHEAHDFPAYIVILLLGHILIPTMVGVNVALNIPVGWQAILWPAITLILALAMIQPAKGAVIAYQWARRMHGFAGQQ